MTYPDWIEMLIKRFRDAKGDNDLEIAYYSGHLKSLYEEYAALQNENEKLKLTNMKKEEPEIEEGDIVKDRTGGGPKMIVDGILNDGCIRTKWWNGSCYTREIFYPNSLLKVY